MNSNFKHFLEEVLNEPYGNYVDVTTGENLTRRSAYGVYQLRVLYDLAESECGEHPDMTKQEFDTLMSPMLKLLDSQVSHSVSRRRKVAALTDGKAEELWREFSDIPMNPKTECIEDRFMHFPKDTHREEIWKWFDKHYSKGVHYLLYSLTL